MDPLLNTVVLWMRATEGQKKALTSWQGSTAPNLSRAAELLVSCPRGGGGAQALASSGSPSGASHALQPHWHIPDVALGSAQPSCPLWPEF